MNVFVEMKKFSATYAGLFQRFDRDEINLLDTDVKFEKLLSVIEAKVSTFHMEYF